MSNFRIIKNAQMEEYIHNTWWVNTSSTISSTQLSIINHGKRIFIEIPAFSGPGTGPIYLQTPLPKKYRPKFDQSFLLHGIDNSIGTYTGIYISVQIDTNGNIILLTPYDKPLPAFTLDTSTISYNI